MSCKGGWEGYNVSCVRVRATKCLVEGCVGGLQRVLVESHKVACVKVCWRASKAYVTVGGRATRDKSVEYGTIMGLGYYGKSWERVASWCGINNNTNKE